MGTYVDEVHDVDDFMNNILSSDMSQRDVLAEVNRLKISLGITADDDDRTPANASHRDGSVPCSGLLFRCPGDSCGVTFKNKKLLNKHMERLKGTSCFTCGKHFKTISDACRHRVNYCKRIVQKRKKVFMCTACNTTMYDRTQYNKHIMSKTCAASRLQDGTTHTGILDAGSETKCDRCKKTFTRHMSLVRHQKKNVSCKSALPNDTASRNRCEHCNATFSYPYYLNRHLASKKCQKKRDSNMATHECPNCARQFYTAVALNRHSERGKCTRIVTSGARRKHGGESNNVASSSSQSNSSNASVGSEHDGRQDDDDDNDDDEPCDRQSALEDDVVRYMFRPVGAELYDMHVFFGNRRHRLASNLVNELERKKGVKWYMCLCVKLCKYDASGELVDTCKPFFRTKTTVTLIADAGNINRQLDEGFFKMSESMESYRRSGSGWILDSVLKLEQNILTFRPLRGSCGNFNLPKTLENNDCILNVNSDRSQMHGECFKYSILAGLHAPAAGTVDPENYEHYHRHWGTLKLITGGTAHMPVSRIGEFEQECDVSVNVIGHVDTFFPVHISARVRTRHVNLLLVSSGTHDTPAADGINNRTPGGLASTLGSKADGEHYHYLLITDINKLLSGQRTNGHHRIMHFCMRCLNSFASDRTLRKHAEMCSEHDPLSVRMPSEGEKWIKFKHLDREMKVKFVIFATFMCIRRKLDQNVPDEVSSVNGRHILKHEPYGFTYYRTSVGGKYPKEPCVYLGVDCMDVFLECMEREENEVMDILSRTHPPVFTVSVLSRIAANRDTCHICKDPFLPGETAVLSHSHYDGYIYGHAHQWENLNYKEASFLPIVTRGFSGYDSRLILSAVGKYGHANIGVIPKTVDTYISMTVGKCRYLDASRFLRDDVTAYVRQIYDDTGIQGFAHLREHSRLDCAGLCIPEVSFCHAYVDRIDRLDETSLPEQCDFYDVVTESTIDDASYQQTKRIWSTLELQTLGELLHVHLLSETLLLADVWEHFRAEVMSTFDLDPTHYLTLSHYAWDCALKISGVSIELLTDLSMHLMVERGTRGGYAFVGSPRYARANSELMGEQFDPSKEKSYLCYFDVNSLFAHVMSSSHLPIRNYRWLDDFEINRLHVLSIAPDADKGLILEVDLDYPESIHKKHDTFPLAPESVATTAADLSPYMLGVHNAIGLTGTHDNNSANTRLLAHLGNKSRYVVHYLNLQFYIKNGMRLRKIHRVLEFTQVPWLRSYMRLCLEKRASASSCMAKKLYKDMGNVIYGKSLQSVRDQLRVKLVTSGAELRKLVSLPTFDSCRVFHDKLVAVNLRRPSVLLNKPIQTGMCVLDLSKLQLYDYHYSYFLPKFATGDRTCDLLMSDTDSLLYRITGTADLYADLKADSDVFDFSSLSTDHPLHSDEGKGVSGRLKFELGDAVLYEFCGLSAKCYSILTDKTCKVAAKSLSDSAARRSLTHQRFKRCILEGGVVSGDVTRLVARGTDIFAANSNRVLVSAYNDKRWFIDKVHSLSYHHREIATIVESSRQVSYLDTVYDMHAGIN